MPTHEPPTYASIYDGPRINGVQYPPLIPLSSIEPKEIEWLWYPYIPFGAASLIFGPGGFGKSHIAVDIAARLTRGVPFYGQEAASGILKPQNVLMLSAEDDFDKVLSPRLLRAGADKARIAFPTVPFVLSANGVKALEHYIKNFDASVVFIDPIVHFIGPKVDMNKANEVRGAIGAFHQLAMKYNLAIIIVGHSRKGGEGEDYEKSMGSADFNNAVRSVLYVTRAPDGTRIMKHVKANYAALGPSLSYRFGHDGNGSFEWTGVYEVDDNYVEPTRLTRSSKRRGMMEFLRKWLAGGPLRSKEIEAMAADEGYDMSAVHRAKNDLGVETFFVRLPGATSNKGSAWWMRLPGDTRTPWLDDQTPAVIDPADAPTPEPEDATTTALPSVDSGRPVRPSAGEARPTLGRQDGGVVDPEPGTGAKGDGGTVGGRGRWGTVPSPAERAAQWLAQKGFANGADQ